MVHGKNRDAWLERSAAASVGSDDYRTLVTEIELVAPCSQNDNRSKWANVTIATKSIKVLSREFASNKRYKPPGFTTEAYDKNEPKNRYNDIICIDATRVVLRDRPSDDDYIHASWITMPDHFKYICTQGPLLETLEDFWHMIFCERSTVLVQLCNFVEGKHEKCRQYFPKSKGASETYGAYKVTYKEAKPDPYDSVKHTVLEVIKKPDHNCESLRLLGVARPYCPRKPCTDAIDYAWQKIRENPETKMIEVLKELRKQRYQAIQSPIQYIFLHMCVLELAAEENLVPRKGKYTPYLNSYQTMLRRYNKKVAAAEAKMEKAES
ncbi:Protein-tyrosine phosphatase [Oesophagostomum dentatum]|uniref:Protein-tyrosine phosphatase n=1 Tax=Oesophagostomum dentatum TaxID=61180 RepID=A0A0B1SSJ2_OESDE|nr:Protein-tyrosine phosphatase [Oesophagostomum dentatum]